jgi:hypothetical protein
MPLLVDANSLLLFYCAITYTSIEYVRQKGMFAKKECSPKRNVRQKGMFAKKECSPKERGVCDVVKKVEMV